MEENKKKVSELSNEKISDLTIEQVSEAVESVLENQDGDNLAKDINIIAC
ncbi:hypothetical protein [Longirhabdus pacifica]|nr:hypothetical protein [Longirhabdus pacifica]